MIAALAIDLQYFIATQKLGSQKSTSSGNRAANSCANDSVAQLTAIDRRPYSPGFDLDPKDIRFLGTPIDLIAE
jgi:predicted Holliday junction resolvase-like endonuclease